MLKGSISFYRKLPDQESSALQQNDNQSKELGEHLVTREISEQDCPLILGCENFLLK